METTGELREAEEKRIEWIIADFLELSGFRYDSPEFSFSGTSWVISIYPDGFIDGDTVVWINLFIVANSLTAPITLDYSFHFKTVDGKADTSAGFTATDTVDKGTKLLQHTRFIERSNLIERKSELLPSGILTVICTLKKKGDINCIVGDELNVDEFTQTEEDITGVWKLQQHFKGILQDGTLSDVVLKVDDQEFKSHRCVLARSPVFLAMMTHDTKEKNTGVVDIKDVESKTFSDLLSYLYTGSDEIITPDNVVKLFTAADKYQVDELKKSCHNYMLKNISVDNFCDILSLSLVHVEKHLTDTCSQFFSENLLEIVKTPKWLMFMKDNVVASNELYIKHVENSIKMKVAL